MLMRDGRHRHDGHGGAMGEFRKIMEKMRGKTVTCSPSGERPEFTYSEIISEQNRQRRRDAEAGQCFQLKAQGTDLTG